MPLLSKLDDQPCPRCGCQETDSLSVQRQSYGQFEKRQCLHCGKIFHAEVADDQPEPGEPQVETEIGLA